METKEPILHIVTTRNDLRDLLKEFATEFKTSPAALLSDRITPDEAMKIIQCSAPTLLKHIREGRIRAYGTPRKRYFFRTEVMEAVRQMINENEN